MIKNVIVGLQTLPHFCIKKQRFKSDMKKFVLFILTWVWLTLRTDDLAAQGWLQRYGSATENASVHAMIRTADGGYFLAGISDGSTRLYLVKTDAEGEVLAIRKLNIGIEIEEEVKMTEAGDGNFIIAFATKNTANPQNINLVKVSAKCDSLWRKTYGDAADERVGDVIRLSDNSIVILGTRVQTAADSAAILKTEPQGNLIFYKTVSLTNRRPNASIRARGIVEAQDRSFYFTTRGASRGDTARLIKLDAAGNFLSERPVQPLTNTLVLNYANAMTFLPDGDLAILGNYFAKIDVNGNLRWFHDRPYTFEPNAFTTTQDGGFAIIGVETNDFQISRVLYSKLSRAGVVEVGREIERYDVLSQNNYRLPRAITQSQNGDVVTATEEGFVQSSSGSNPRLMRIGLNGTLHSNIVSGKVFIDPNLNCQMDGGEQGFPNVIVEFASRTMPSKVYHTKPDADGNYYIALDTGVFDIRIQGLPSTWNYCAENVSFADDFRRLPRNLALQAKRICPQLEVNLSTAYLSRCQKATYQVRYCNNGAGVARDAYVIVTFDSLLRFQNASLPVASRVGRAYRFNIGTIQTSKCGSFDIQVATACGDSLRDGQILCTEARIYPDTFCTPNVGWSGGQIRVEGRCEADSVRFRIQNIGSGGAERASGVIVEDVVIYAFPQLPDIESNNSISLSLPKTGKTWRIQVPQVNNYPGNSSPTAAVEGCRPNSTASFSIGNVNQFAEDDGDKFLDKDCQILRGGLVAAEIEPYPIGYRDQRFIEQEAEVEFQIRFRNLLTDTTTILQIRDSLPDFMDVNSLELGASSHPYRLSIFGDKILKFTFDKINLPPYSRDSIQSLGYLKFRIKLRPNLPNGTRVQNMAAINYNFTTSATTNQTLHTIGRNYLLTAIIDKPILPNVQVKAYPNPFREKAIFEILGENISLSTFGQGTLLGSIEGKLSLYDLTGKLVRVQTFDQNRFEFERAHLNAGIYIFKIENKGQLLATGKLVVSQ